MAGLVCFLKSKLFCIDTDFFLYNLIYNMRKGTGGREDGYEAEKERAFSSTSL